MTLVKVNGSGYCCGSGKGHLHRSPARCDDLVERTVIARLSEPDICDLLKPPERPGVDSAALRTEVRKLKQRKADLSSMFADGVIGAADLATGSKQIRRRLETAEQQLAAATEPDQLSDFRDPLNGAAAVWDDMSLGRRREIVRRAGEVAAAGGSSDMAAQLTAAYMTLSSLSVEMFIRRTDRSFWSLVTLPARLPRRCPARPGLG